MSKVSIVAVALVLCGCYGPYGNSQIGYRDRPNGPLPASFSPYERSCAAMPTSKEEMECSASTAMANAQWHRCRYLPTTPFPESDPDFAKCGLSKADLPKREERPRPKEPPTLDEVNRGIDDLNRAEVEMSVEQSINNAVNEMESDERLHELGVW